MNEHELPREARAWLAEVEQALVAADPSDRLEILDGIRAHILDALDGGEAIDVVLDRLGPPGAVASQATADNAPHSNSSLSERRYWDTSRVLQAIAAALVVVGILVIGFLPSSTEVSTSPDGTLVYVTKSGFQNLIYLSPIFTASMATALLLTFTPLVVRGESRATFTVIAALLLAVLTVVAVVLVGNWLLIPAMVLSALSAVFAVTGRNRSRRQGSASLLTV